MIDGFGTNVQKFYNDIVLGYINAFAQNPMSLLILVVDITIVIFLAAKIIKFAKNSRAWQLLKGIFFLLIANALSYILQLRILNFILSIIMTWGVFALIVIFQPELRRALEQLGTNKFTRFFGIDKDIETRTKEDIYKIIIATTELAKSKTGALIVIERDIQIKDIIGTGISMNSEVSPQLLVNIFVPNTPLHDGAVVISNNKIAAAACMLPLASDSDIAKELGTRHRAAIGISKESDAIAIVVSEETGKISIAKDGTLIADVKEEAMKKILIKHIVTKRFGEEKITKLERLKNINFGKEKKEEENKKD
ncbi:MAG: diadenylate cyclase CdaA [Clostridia bacterium]|nr:diadenylate cyclase CdaA [Clostridia bacterium]